MDVDERRLLRESLTTAVASASPGGLRTAVGEFGWHELLAEEPAVAVAELADLQGELLTDATLLDDAVLAAAGFAGPAVVVYPQPPYDEPTNDNGTVTGVVSTTEGDRLVVPVRRHGEVTVVTVEQPLPHTEPTGLDPASGWRQVRCDVGGARCRSGVTDADTWRTMRVAAHRFLAHELTAVGRQMLALAVTHVADREQFGRKLGSFQAVQHALADVRVWQECAELATAAAWEDGLTESAELAKIIAGRFARTAAANCQQVLGGMGFTWEHDFHRYLRRALVLEPLLGSAAHLRSRLGARLRTSGVPRIAAL